jgi:hypothetical protein
VLQNVALQMGLRLSSRSGQRILCLQRFVMRCEGCSTVCKSTSKLFCPACGHPTLSRVSVTVGANGKEEYGVRKKHVLRGTRCDVDQCCGCMILPSICVLLASWLVDSARCWAVHFARSPQQSLVVGSLCWGDATNSRRPSRNVRRHGAPLPRGPGAASWSIAVRVRPQASATLLAVIAQVFIAPRQAVGPSTASTTAARFASLSQETQIWQGWSCAWQRQKVAGLYPEMCSSCQDSCRSS